MRSISCQQLLIASGVDTHTYIHACKHTHTDVRTETILRNQACADRWPLHDWLKNNAKAVQCFGRGKLCKIWLIHQYFTNAIKQF